MMEDDFPRGFNIRTKKGYETLDKYSPDLIIPFIIEGAILPLHGISVSFGSVRLQTFTKGVECVNCGLKIKYFALQTFVGRIEWHLNPYGITNHGKHELFTSDHIIPITRGGAHGLHNRQPMCETCNIAKGDAMPGEDWAQRKAVVAEEQR